MKNVLIHLPVIYSKIHALHNPKYEIYDGTKEPYAEKPERLFSIVKTLQKNTIPLIAPRHFEISHIEKIHQKEYCEFLQNRSSAIKPSQVLYPSYFIMDTYTPITHYTYTAAQTAVAVALTGAQYILEGQKIVYALCRPPGHHAEYKTMGGYCYFNNAAIAADYFATQGKVAILDIDFHHGNGTQSIFYNRSDVLYVSIHADPHERFPYYSGFENEQGIGKGFGYNKNYPLALGVTDKKYHTVLSNALNDIKNFHPQFLVVSAGFDTYEKDPIGGFQLTLPFYKVIGEEIARLKLPTLIIQEGGYHVGDLGEIAWNFLRGITHHA